MGELKNKIKKCKSYLQTKFSVNQIGIFGSYAKGTQRKSSDLDILVVFRKSPGLFTFLELEEYLSQLLGIKVDLVTKNSLKPVIGKTIMKEVVYI